MNNLNGLEIAVIGMSARFPSSDSVEKFWEILRNGQEGLVELSDEELLGAGLDLEKISSARYVRKVGLINRKCEFDARLFGYSPVDAQSMDPQFAVFHELVWEALENAGYTSEKYDGHIGLFAGAGSNVRWLSRVMNRGGNLADGYALSSLTESGYLCSRVAHKLDLTGPALSVNATCATSLVSIHLACQALNTGECDIALAGGVRIPALEKQGYSHQEDMILSPDGTCRPFDKEAQGTALGEGAGILVLKRLEEALEDKDNIVAVIKGSAVNNDGQLKAGFTAPGVEGQVDVISMAQLRAEVESGSIQYIETHGTGTKLGDPIEISALKKVFGANEGRKISIGSVKSNIGHAGESAGVAGAIKTILALQHGQIPPSLNFEEANPLLGLEDSPFEVARELMEWPRSPDGPRRAGVSSFGLGGSNAHIILEEYQPEDKLCDKGREHNLLTLSASTEDALLKMLGNLAGFLKVNPQTSVADMCFTLHQGRKKLPFTQNLLVTDVQDTIGKLESIAEVKVNPFDQRNKKLCMMFPGQGTQYVNMGRKLYETEEVFRSLMDEGFAIAREVANYDLKSLIFTQLEQAQCTLLETQYTQPILFIFEYALASLYRSWGCKAQAYVGHSLGEYVAACLAGVFSYRDALWIIIRRGQLVQALPEGDMLAVALGVGELSSIIEEDLSIAAVNTPQRTVVSGSSEDISRLNQKLADAGYEGTILRTSHAFHSRHMDPILEEFKSVVSTVHLSKPHTPFISNVSGDWISDEEACSAEYWVSQLRQAVRFSDGISKLINRDSFALLEVGPGNGLSNFALQCAEDVSQCQVIQTVPGVSRRNSENEISLTLEALGQLYARGVEIDWSDFYQGQQRWRIPLPTYPFAETCYYPDEFMRIAAAGEAAVSSSHSVVSDAVGASLENVRVINDMEGLTKTERSLLQIWAKYLGSNSLGVEDNLLSRGVDSLMSIRVISDIRETFKTEINLETIFSLPTVKEQARDIDQRLGDDVRDMMLPDIEVTNSLELPVLSASQKRLWIISQLDGDSTAYNNAFCVFIKDLCVDTLHKTAREVVQRHAVLRTIYLDENGTIKQRVQTEFEIDIPVIDMTNIEESRQYDTAVQYFNKELLKPISLSEGLVIRFTLIKFDDRKHMLMVTQHHISSDNWSLNLLATELGEIYAAYQRGENHSYPPLAVQYIDYANWQEKWLKSESVAAQIAFWKDKLAGIPEVHNLPTDFPRPKYQSYRGTQLMTNIGKEISAGIDALSKRYATTFYMTMQAAFSVLIGRYSNEEDVVIGCPVANRLHKQVEPLIGFFVNTLALRTDLSGNPSFEELLAQTKKNLLDSYSNAGVPFEMLVEELKPERSLSYDPIVQVQLIILDQSQEYGSSIAQVDTEDEGTFTLLEMIPPFSKYDLTLYIRETDKGIACAWEYASDLFKAGTIKRMAQNFERLLQGIIEAPQTPVFCLPLLSDTEKALQFEKWHIEDKSSASYRMLSELVTRDDNQLKSVSEEPMKFSLFYFASDAGKCSTGKYTLLMEGAKFADKHGFEAVWTPERHFDSFGGAYPNPVITAAALSSITDNVKIRAGSCVLPLHNPVRVVEDWSVVDNISGGRVGIGFAAGWSEKDFVLNPGQFENRKDVLKESLSLVKKLWRGETVDLPNGEGCTESINILPVPIQPELPTWVTTTGNIEAFQHAGREGENVLTHLLGQSIEALAEKIKAYREEWRKAGHPGDGVVTLLAHTFIASSEDIIFDHVKEPFKNYLAISAGTPQAIARVVGGSAGESILNNGGGSTDLDAITEVAFQRYYTSNALLGTVNRCQPVVEAIAAAGVDEIACLIDFGVDESLVLDSLKNLAELKERFAPQLNSPKDASGSKILPEQDSKKPCLHQQFESVAEQYPDKIALYFENDHISYSELNKRANQLAHYLLDECQVRVEDLVVLCMDRSIECIVGILAILKAGCAYVPVEPSLPAARKMHIIAETKARVILTHAAVYGSLTEFEVDHLIEVDTPASFSSKPEVAPVTQVDSRNLSHIIFTSGSTGKPKGVMIEHQNVIHLFDSAPTCMQRNSGDVGCLFSSYAFDVSVWEIWASLLYGAPLVLFSKQDIEDMRGLYKTLVEKKVTKLSITSSAFYALQSIIPLEDHKLSLDTVIFVGEVLQPKLLQGWYQDGVSNPPIFINAWGPAETTIYASYRILNDQDFSENCNNIGCSFKNGVLAVLSPTEQPQPVGVAGEVYVGGACVSRGYLNNPELTKEKFVPNPFTRDENDLWYKTGDICRWLDDGSLEFLERKDNQIKLRGFRIELTEIELVLNSHARVKEALVMAVGEGTQQHLVAYICANGGSLGEDDVVRLKQYLTKQLPAYMVPQSYTFVEAIPLNQNGKYDRSALRALTKLDIDHTYVAPRNKLEEQLEALWCELLDLEKVSVTANFFSVGGQSLIAIRMVNELSKILSIELETRYIFEYSSIESLALLISNSGFYNNGVVEESDDVIEFEI